jgi:small conductance mechanosensitive channel
MSSDLSALPSTLSVLIAVLTILALAAAEFLGRRIARIARSTNRLREGRRQQLLTLIQALRWVAAVLIITVGLLMLLSSLGVDITPLLASVGVAGLAISLGAQTLIKDIIGGLLVLIENQYVVGDSIQVGGISGQVERLTLRATYLRDVNGHLHVVPNGEIRIVSNMTKEWSRALVDIGVAYEEDPDRVQLVLEEAAQSFVQDSFLKAEILETPQVLVPFNLGDWAFTARVVVKTRPGKQWEVARELRKCVLAACEREGVTLPYPRREIWVQESGFDGHRQTGNGEEEGT